MQTNLSKLIESINRVGTQNISLLSRMTGMPTETVRYAVKKRFPSMGLAVRTPVNLSALGLERYFVSMRFTKEAGLSAPAILRKLSSNAFLTYSCESVLERRFFAFFAVPFSLGDEFQRFLDALSGGVLRDYTTERLEWSRHCELKSRYYDFATGEWSINWAKVAKSGENPPAPVRDGEVLASPDVDSTDVLIIKELQLDSWRNIAEIARKLGLKERTVRWHYRKHVIEIANAGHVTWMPVTPRDFGKAVGLVHEFNNVSKEKLAKLRYLFNNFPFAWFEAGRDDGYYQVHSALPSGYFAESSRFLNANLAEIVEDWKTLTIDLSTTYRYTIPYENFDAKNGWFFNREASLEAVLPRKMKTK